MSTPIYLVTLSMGYCSRTFGISPCLATGEKCFNTYPTCKYASAFNDAGKEYKFTSADVPVPFDGVRPYVKSVKLLPTEITTTFTISGRVTVELRDEPEGDVGIDPYVTSRTAFPNIPGTFWKKFLTRNRNYKNRILKVYEGWSGEAEGSYDLRWAGRMDNATYEQGVLKIEAVDFLKDLAKVEVPPKLDIKVNGNFTSAATEFLVTSVADLDAAGTVMIDDEVMSYSSISGLTLTGVTRCLYGTYAAEHDHNAKVQKCRVYLPANPFDILSEMLLTDAAIPAAYVDSAAFAYWKTYPETDIDISAVITSPTNLSKLFFEIADLVGAKVWFSEANKITICRDIPFDPLRSFITISDEDNILHGSAKVDRNEKARLSRAFIYWEKSPTGDMDEVGSFGRLDVAVDAIAESAVDYSDVVEKKVFSRWVSIGSQVEETVRYFARNCVMRRVWRNRDAPAILSIEVDLKDEGIKTGDYAYVTTDEFTDFFGNPIQGSEFQVVRRERKEGKISLNLLRVGHHRSAFIGANTLSAWATATPAEKLYGYICADDATLPTDQDGYYIY